MDSLVSGYFAREVTCDEFVSSMMKNLELAELHSQSKKDKKNSRYEKV